MAPGARSHRSHATIRPAHVSLAGWVIPSGTLLGPQRTEPGGTRTCCNPSPEAPPGKERWAPAYRAGWVDRRGRDLAGAAGVFSQRLGGVGSDRPYVRG